jgi:hypothetical protein
MASADLRPALYQPVAASAPQLMRNCLFADNDRVARWIEKKRLPEIKPFEKLKPMMECMVMEFWH